MSIVLEETDETVFWLELLLEAGIVSQYRLGSLLNEANELASIFVTHCVRPRAFLLSPSRTLARWIPGA
jgi:hypothetical protein